MEGSPKPLRRHDPEPQKALQDAARALGKRGGDQTSKLYGPDYFRALQAKRKAFRGGRPAQKPQPKRQAPKSDIARDHFSIGDRVQSSDYAIQCNINRRKRVQGTVVGFSKDPRCMRVRRDSVKHGSTYYHGFWERINT